MASLCFIGKKPTPCEAPAQGQTGQRRQLWCSQGNPGDEWGSPSPPAKGRRAGERGPAQAGCLPASCNMYSISSPAHQLHVRVPVEEESHTREETREKQPQADLLKAWRRPPAWEIGQVGH